MIIETPDGRAVYFECRDPAKTVLEVSHGLDALPPMGGAPQIQGVVEAVSEGDEIAAFYAARLDEEEVTAMAATPGPWTDTGQRDVFVEQLATSVRTSAVDLHLIAEMEPCGDHDDRRRDDARHIVLHDPARALREVAASWKLLRDYQRLRDRKASHESWCRAMPNYTPFTRPGYPSDLDLLREGHFLEQALPLMLGLLKEKAAVYSDHPEYKRAWRP